VNSERATGAPLCRCRQLLGENMLRELSIVAGIAALLAAASASDFAVARLGLLPTMSAS